MNTENVVIEFTDKGIDEIYAKLEAADAESAAKFKASNAAFVERRNQLDSLAVSGAKNVKSMNDLATASANVTKNITNGATNEAIKQTGTLIDKATDSTKKYADSLNGLKQEYKDLVAQAIKAGETTPLGKDFLKQAGEVRRQINEITEATRNFGSQTETLNAIGEGIRGIGAGFEVSNASQILFGKSSAALEEQLVKIQATMALVNGLTEIQNVLSEQSALRQGLLNAQLFIRNNLEKIGITFKTVENGVDAEGNAILTKTVVVQAIENALLSESVIVRYAAAAAQWLLNAAMYAFPIIAIIAGLVAIVALFGGFSDSIKESAEEQIKLNAVQQENLKVMEQQDALVNKLSADLAARYQRELDLLKAVKASTEDIRAKEAELQQERNRNAQYQKGFHAQEISDLDQNRQALAGLTASLAAYNKVKAETGSDDFDKSIEAIKGKLDIVNTLIKQGEDAQQNAADQALQTQILAAQQQQQIEQEGLAFQKTIIDAKLRFAKQGSEQQLALQLASAKNDRDTAIANLTSSNQSRADIEAAFLEKQRDLNIAYNNLILKDKIDLNNASLIAVQKGSGAELDLKLANLQLENQVELNNVKLTNDERLALTKKYINDVNVLLFDFGQKQNENSLTAEIARNEAKLSLLEKGDEQELILKQKYLALQEQLDIVSIDKNIQGTELGEAKKAEIIARYAAQTRQLLIDSQEVILKAREVDNQRTAEFLQKQADLEANNVNTTLQRRQQLELQAFDNAQTLSDKQLDIDSQRYLNGEIAEKDYYEILAKYQDDFLLNKQAKQNASDKIFLDNLLAVNDKVAQIASDGLSALSALVESVSAQAQAAYDKDNAANEAAYANKQETEAQYEVNKNAADKRLAAAKKKAAEQDKEISLFQIGINTAQAAIKAVATAPNYIVGAVEAALALAFGAIQYAAAASKPIPEFYKGTQNAPEGWAWVGERGPELVWMKSGSKVKTHEESVKMINTPSLRHSFADRVDRSPVPSENAEQAMRELSKQGLSIDMNAFSKMIGDEIGNHISKLPLTMFNFDKNGFQASIHQGNSTTQFLNSRYSTQR